MTLGSQSQGSAKGESFAKMFSSVIKDKRITDKDFRILAFIKSYSSNWKAYQPHIARELGVSASTVARSINRLDAAGYLTYEMKQTKVGSERRNVRMRHRPSHWDDTRTKPKRPKSHQTEWPKNTPSEAKYEEDGQSNLTAVPIKCDGLGLSDLTYNEEKNKTNYEDSETESHDFVSDGAISRETIRQLWEAYNEVPNGYIQISGDPLVPVYVEEALRLIDESDEVLQGLQLSRGQRNKYDADAEHYRRLVQERRNALAKSSVGRPRMFLRRTVTGFAVFISPEEYDKYRIAESSSENE